MGRRDLALASIAAILAAVAAACGTVSVTPRSAPPTAAGGSQIRVTGAATVNVTKVATCTARGGGVNAVFDSFDGGVAWTLQVEVQRATAAGTYPVMTAPPAPAATPSGSATPEPPVAPPTSVTLADSKGNVWESAAGGSGEISLDPGLVSGSLDAVLVNSADGSKAHASGTWRCR